LFGGLQLLAGQVVEPLVYGRSSGLSPIAIVLSASFWTWLWGPIGLVLATPLTVCLVVLGRHVDRLQFIDVLLGNQPALTPPQLIYQRMLAGDPIEASQQAHNYLEDAPLEEYYDTILLNGLRLAEADARLGRLDDERLDRVVATVNEVVDDLETHEDRQIVLNAETDTRSDFAKLETIEDPEVSLSLTDRWRAPRAVLCIPGSSKLDEAAALVLAQMLRRRGLAAAAEEADALSMSKFFALELSSSSLFCVCYVDNPSSAKIHYAVRRLRKKSSGAPIMVALLGTETDARAAKTEGAVTIAGNFAGVVKSIVENAVGQAGRVERPLIDSIDKMIEPSREVSG
jgi:hypothetical protein